MCQIIKINFNVFYRCSFDFETWLFPPFVSKHYFVLGLERWALQSFAVSDYLQDRLKNLRNGQKKLWASRNGRKRLFVSKSNELRIFQQAIVSMRQKGEQSKNLKSPLVFLRNFQIYLKTIHPLTFKRSIIITPTTMEAQNKHTESLELKLA
jgi:hypothetical protein